MFGILGPMDRVVADVLADGVELAFVADHAFVIVALPDRDARRFPHAVGAAGPGALVDGEVGHVAGVPGWNVDLGDDPKAPSGGEGT